MGNILSGSMMVFFVLIVTAFVAFLEQGTLPSGESVGCDSNGNVTTCEGGSPTSFLSTFFDVAVTGISGAPLVVNAFYLLVTVGILVIGFALIVAGLIGTPFGGG